MRDLLDDAEVSLAFARAVSTLIPNLSDAASRLLQVLIDREARTIEALADLTGLDRRTAEAELDVLTSSTRWVDRLDGGSVRLSTSGGLDLAPMVAEAESRREAQGRPH